MNTNYNYILSVIIPQQLLYQITLLFAGIIILVSGIIVIYLFRKNRFDNRRKEIQKNIADLISEIAICESIEELEETYTQPRFENTLIKNKQTSFDKKVMTKELAETCKKLSGNSEENVQWLFEKTGLEKNLLNQLNDKRWYLKAEAIQQMASLNQNKHLRKIYHYTNHANLLVRMDAQVATIKLTGFKGLRFLKVISHPITAWQQLQLLNELSRQKPDNFESLSQWLKSPNETVVEFALRLVGIYQRYEQYENVVDCLSHSSIHIQEHAVSTLSQIHMDNTASLYVSHYHSLEKSAQFMIIQFLKDMGTDAEIPFLRSILNHPDNSFKLEATRAIKIISNSKFVIADHAIDENMYPWNIILKQINSETA